jgi:hypothetical protein
MDIIYAGGNEKRAHGAIARYCRDWWSQEGLDNETGIEDADTLSDEEVTRMYFENENVIMNGEEA